jgi:hypothetical protein
VWQSAGPRTPKVGSALWVVVRYKDLKTAFGKLLGRIAEFLSHSLRHRINSVTLENVLSILPRKGQIVGGRPHFNPDDERFLVKAIEKSAFAPEDVLFRSQNLGLG